MQAPGGNAAAGQADPAPHSRKPWSSHSQSQSKLSHHDHDHDRHEPEAITREQTRRSTTTHASSARSAKWWRVRLFRGMVKDVRRRAPYYWSDWTDAWDYRVVPATVYMFFAKCVLLLLVLTSWGEPKLIANALQYSTGSGLLAGHV